MAQLTGMEIFKTITNKVKNVEPKFAKKFAAEFKIRVKNKTPVDTGRLRAAWNVRVTGNKIVAENQTPYAGYVKEAQNTWLVSTCSNVHKIRYQR